MDWRYVDDLWIIVMSYKLFGLSHIHYKESIDEEVILNFSKSVPMCLHVQMCNFFTPALCATFFHIIITTVFEK